MTKGKIIKAATAARIFLNRIKDLTEDDYVRVGVRAGTKNTAAVRRASMELTRALSEMRR